MGGDECLFYLIAGGLRPPLPLGVRLPDKRRRALEIYSLLLSFASFLSRKEKKRTLNKDVKHLIQLDEYKQQIAATVQTLKEAGDSL